MTFLRRKWKKHIIPLAKGKAYVDDLKPQEEVKGSVTCVASLTNAEGRIYRHEYATEKYNTLPIVYKRRRQYQ